MYLGRLPPALDRYLAAVPAMSRLPIAPFCRRILGIATLTVKTANDRFANRRFFRWIRNRESGTNEMRGKAGRGTVMKQGC